MNKQDAIKSVEKSTEAALTDCANRAKSSSSEFKALMIKAINSYKAQAIKMIEVANTEEAIKCLANKFNSEFLYNTAHAAVYKRMRSSNAV